MTTSTQNAKTSMLGKLGAPILPKEHGAWMALLAPIVVGSFAVRPAHQFWPTGFALVILATVFGFLATTPLRLVLKAPHGPARRRLTLWLVIYSLTSSASFLALVGWLGRPLLLWFIIPAFTLALAYFMANAARTHRSVPMELVGIAGLALSCLAASYVQQGAVTKEAVALYALLVIWFADRMMTTIKTLDCIRNLVTFKTIRQKAMFYKTGLVIHAASLATVFIVIALSDGSAPLLAIIPFLTATFKNAMNIFSLKVIKDPMKIGFGEMRLGLVFVSIMIAVFRLH